MKVAEKIQGKRNVYVRVSFRNLHTRVTESVDFSYDNLNVDYEANSNKLYEVVKSVLNMRDSFGIVISIADDEYDVITDKVDRIGLVGRKKLGDNADVELRIHDNRKWQLVEKYITTQTMHRQVTKFLMDACSIHMTIQNL